MAPKRRKEDLLWKSIWDEPLVDAVITNKKHRNRIWQYLITHPEQDICDIPFLSWSVRRDEAEVLQRDFVRYTSKIIQRNESSRGDSIKLLIELQDGHRIETVIMKHHAHSTVCVSSQIGCQMGCRFCATGTMGIIGNLSSGEILEQLILANNITPIRNVVFMGMGEPLNNYDNLKLSVEFMIDVTRMGLSTRHVTVSTVGVLGSLRRLTTEMPYVNLALSLHAPNQSVRLKIVPSASAHHIDKLMSAVDLHIQKNLEAYSQQKRKRDGSLLTSEELDDFVSRGYGMRPNKVTGVMIEYILIKNINDREEHAMELGRLLAGRRDHVLLNLIPYNPTAVAEDYEPPSEEDVEIFHSICKSAPFSIHTRVRHEKGQDIAGACGQLALVNPSSSLGIATTATSTRDIEDYGNRTAAKAPLPVLLASSNTAVISAAAATAAVMKNRCSSLHCYFSLAACISLAFLSYLRS